MLEIDKKNVVPAKELEVLTKPYDLKIGFKFLTNSDPYPQYSGLRITPLTGGKVYLINPEGCRQYIPNPDTYNNLFRDWNGIIRVVDIDAITLDQDISVGAILAKGTSTNKIYLISNNRKRWIVSPAVMDKYYFDWRKVYVVPQILINSIPSGANWT